jgi:2,3-bisphosphoglycerate-dependent phosphoglycerate mutase
MVKLVLVRHGRSEWNELNLFTGWTDVDLTDVGVSEAKETGNALKSKKIKFDVAYTSVLKRAIRTLWIILDEMDLMYVPVVRHWSLNEKHYGVLQGLNKNDVLQKYGEKKFMEWRRSYDISPPGLKINDKRHPSKFDAFKSVPLNKLPNTECLKDTYERFIKYYKKEIEKDLKLGKNVLIVAHGNSLRSLVKYLDNVSNGDILSVDIPTGIPLVYELDDSLKPIRHYYVGDAKKIKKMIDDVKNQGKNR